MLMIEQASRPLGPAVRAQGAGVPRITPVHDPVDRRNSDLSFHIDTGGRPAYRVLIARDRALFAPAQASQRNASNFYDSQRDGLLHDDGPPSFYLVPRSVLHAMLPATRLYYTAIAYDDADGTRAVYAHPPESLPSAAPSVALAADLAGSLSLMFGTPISRLTRLGASLGGFALAEEESGEDHEPPLPEAVGLADEETADDDDEHHAHAAALDAEGEEAEGGAEAALALADGDAWRMPQWEEGESTAAALDEAAPNAGVDDIWGGAEGLTADGCVACGHGDGYDDGFGDSDNLPAAQGYGEEGEDFESGAQALADDDAAHAFDTPMREPLPEMLPDEDADGARPAQAGQDDDEVEVESAQAASEHPHDDGYDDSYGDAYGTDYPDEDPAQPATQPAAQPELAQGAAAEAPGAARVPFDIAACKAILARIAPFESGTEGFARTVEDGEFAGRFGSAHPAHQRYHLGLTFGAFPFVQEHGTLGQLLQLMRERDRAAFDTTFPEADELIAVTTAAGGPRAWESADGLSARLRPVGGTPLWQEPWPGRFKRAAQHPPFQGAQNEMAARLYVQPVLTVARQIGLDSEQGLTLLIDRAVQMGAPAALAHVLEAASPVGTPALRQQALASLGLADLAALQRAAALPVSGSWDVPTHAALIAALRASPRSPVPVPSGAEIVAALLRQAQGRPWAERMARLRDASSATRLFQL